MKSFDKFKRELANLGQEENDLSKLQSALSGIREEQSPCDQDQRWAWTRLEARLFSPPEGQGNFLPVRIFGWGILAAAALWMVLAFPVSSLPRILNTGSDLYAVAFHAKQTGADVIWVDGYNLIPSSSLQ